VRNKLYDEMIVKKNKNCNSQYKKWPTLYLKICQAFKSSISSSIFWKHKVARYNYLTRWIHCMTSNPAINLQMKFRFDGNGKWKCKRCFGSQIIKLAVILHCFLHYQNASSDHPLTPTWNALMPKIKLKW
jgi:hypothetical protein